MPSQLRNSSKSKSPARKKPARAAAEPIAPTAPTPAEVRKASPRQVKVAPAKPVVIAESAPVPEPVIAIEAIPPVNTPAEPIVDIVPDHIEAEIAPAEEEAGPPAQFAAEEEMIEVLDELPELSADLPESEDGEEAEILPPLALAELPVTQTSIYAEARDDIPIFFSLTLDHHAFEKASEVLQLNLEAMMASSRTITTAYEELGQELVEFARKQVEGASVAWNLVTEAKTPEAMFKVQGSYARSLIEDAIEQGSKTTIAMIDAASKASEPLMRSCTAAFERA